MVTLFLLTAPLLLAVALAGSGRGHRRARPPVYRRHSRGAARHAARRRIPA
jgi:hypothetical protein